MKLFADEGIELQVVEQLRRDGHDVLYVAEMSPSISDSEALSLANTHHAVLLTADKDFGELVFRLGQIHSGVILLRLAGAPLDEKAIAVSNLLNTHPQQVVGSFTVISRGLVRIRRPR